MPLGPAITRPYLPNYITFPLDVGEIWTREFTILES